MTLATATGCIAGPMERLRKCFEATPDWDKFIDGTTHEHFHFNLIDEPEDKEEDSTEELDAIRPFVYMVPDYPAGFTIVSDASEGSFRSGGAIKVLMETESKRLGEGTQQEIARLWDNCIGVLLKNLFFAGWDEQLMDIRRIDSVQLRTPKTAIEHGQGSFLQAMFRVQWGRDV